MNKPIDISSLLSAVTAGVTGYLVIDAKTGRSYTTQNHRKRHIDGKLRGNPLSPKIFGYEPKSVQELWAKSRNFTDFTNNINKHWRISLGRPNRAKYTQIWADIFGYDEIGKWQDDGLEGIFDIAAGMRVADSDEFTQSNLKELIKLDEGYELIGRLFLLYEELSHEYILLRPQGKEFSFVGRSQDDLLAFDIPDKYAHPLAALRLVLTL